MDTQEVGPDVSVLIADYIKVRDLKSKADEAHKNKMQQYTSLLEQLETHLLKFLHNAGVDSTAVKGLGTAYIRTVQSATIADPEIFKKFVIDNSKYELVDWKANANAVRDHATSAGALPPGVNYSSAQKIGIRRS